MAHTSRHVRVHRRARVEKLGLAAIAAICASGIAAARILLAGHEWVNQAIMISHENTPTPAKHHRPFSLRELFWLVTLACILTGLQLSSELTSGERRLLGLASGGALLGVLIFRWRGRSAWLPGVLMGLLGTVIAFGMIAQPLLDHYETLRIKAPAALPEYRNHCVALAAASTGLGLCLAIVTVVCFCLPLWAMSSGEGGMAHWLRRQPRRACLWFAVIMLSVLVFLNVDRIMTPRAWSPGRFVGLQRRHPVAGDSSLPGTRLAISRRGDWLAVYLSDFLGGQTQRFKGTLLVRRERCAFPAGGKPVRQLSFQPVAIGAAMEVTKSSEPSMNQGRLATQRVGRP